VDTVAQLEEDVALARAFTPYSARQLAEIEQKAYPVMGQAQWYKRDAPQNPK
jgi:hypothetical protein